MSDKKWLVPDVIDPAQKVCVQLEIPNDIKHIAAFWGALEQLGKAYNWEDSYADGSLTAYVWQPIIEQASQDVRFGANCMLDCEEVEDCLETSTIINIIEGDIITNETNITNNETNITNNETNITNILSGGDDTNVYPPLPTGSEPDELCGAAYRIAQEIIDLVEQTVIDVGLLAFAAWLLTWLGIGGWLGTQLSLFWDYILANEIALTGVDFDVYLDQLAEALYCAELDRAQAIIDLDIGIPVLRRDALIKGIESPTDAQIALWAFVGSFDDTQDCSSFDCGAWCYEFDFTASDGGWLNTPGWNTGDGRGTYAGAQGWQTNLEVIEIWESAVLTLRLNFGTDVIITDIIVEYEGDVWGAWDHAEIQSSIMYTTDLVDRIISAAYYPETPPGTGSFAGSVTAQGVAVHQWNSYCLPGNTIGLQQITKITLKGLGANPFGSDNC